MNENEGKKVVPLEIGDDIVTLTRLAIGEDFPLWKIQVLHLLNSEKEGNLPPYLQQDLLNLCLQRPRPYRFNFFDIAEMCVLMTAKAPKIADEWLRFFVLGGLKIADEKSAHNYWYHHGLALGIFQAGVWLDQNQKDASLKFYEVLPELVVELITHSCPAMEPAVGHEMLRWQEGYPCNPEKASSSPRFESELSRAIKAYFRPELDGAGRLDVRQAHVYNIQQTMADWHDAGKKLTTLGAMILRQINFALAGNMCPLAHATALARYLNEILQPKPPEQTDLHDAIVTDADQKNWAATR